MAVSQQCRNHNFFVEVVMTKDLYSTIESRLDTIMGDADFWVKMQRCRTTEAAHCQTDVEIMSWFRETYGIQLLPSDVTMIGFLGEVKIVDEEKYMIFLLKWA